MTQIFPLNYFTSLFRVRKIFPLRKKINWFETIIIFIFLISLLVMPVTIFYARESQLPAERFFNKQEELFTDKTAEEFQDLMIENNRLKNTESKVLAEDNQNVFSINMNPESVTAKDYIILNEDFWYIKSGKQQFKNTYTSFFEPKKVRNGKDFLTFFEENFYQSNRITIVLSYSLSIGMMLLVLFLCVFLGGAFFLWLGRKSQFSDIKTYHEALNLMLLAYSLPIIIATLYSIFNFQVTSLIGISTVLGVLCLVLLYSKTKFKDQKEGE